MAEYIEREAAIAKIREEGVYGSDYTNPEREDNVVDMIESIPAADVRPVARGKWVDEPIKSVRYHCSVCQGRFDYTWRFCPNCGAKMDGGEP